MCMIILALNTQDNDSISINPDHIIYMRSLTQGTELTLSNSEQLLVKESVIEINILLQDGYKITAGYQH